MPDRLAPGRYLLDPASSTVTLRHKTFWGLKTVPGGFGGLRASGEIAADGTAHGTLAIDAASLDTKHAKRDEHLRSAHFFDVEQHPEITFENQEDLLAARPVGDTVEARRYVETPGAQLGASPRRGDVGGETRPVGFEVGGIVGAEDRHRNSFRQFACLYKTSSMSMCLSR